ncbi:uncharacterized protein LOC128954663 [Oppia nitens]|uniref:uncharacterized protein LOC128954663 n=1 Tax=Oppia nitens TaxID=1686743 RepID=UPI0023DA2D78|nr:uncharacterized protein LOC128954663 [Oppia nitens]
MINNYHYLVLLLSSTVLLLVLLSGTGMYAVLINEDLDNEIDNLLADNDRMALPYRRLPESLDSFQYEICNVFYQKELKIADYLSHKYHYNRHLRVMAANMSLTRMRIWDKYCKYDINFMINIFKTLNRLLIKTKEYTKYAFQVIQMASQPDSGITIPDIMCISDNYYDKLTNAFNQTDHRDLSIKINKDMSDAWMPYLSTVLNLNNNNNRLTTSTSDCRPLNITYEPVVRPRVSRQMGLFDALNVLIKV